MSKLIIIALFGFLILGFCFYWFEYRPHKARITCINQLDHGQPLIDANTKYTSCIISHGLEPEYLTN